MKRPVIVDATDAAGSFYALAYAAKHFDLLGVTVAQGADAGQVAGMCALLQLPCPVVAGADKPIIREKTHADRGARGEGGYPLPLLPAGALTPGYAWDFYDQQAEKHAGALEIITLGSLTNLAIAGARYPALAGLLACVTLYAGARAGGNVPQAPQSEWNLYNDPEAGYMALALPVKKRAVDLNTALLCRLDAEGQGPLPELVCAALALDQTECRDVRALLVSVETDSALTRGKLVIEHDTAGKGDTPNCDIILDCDYDALRARILSTFDNGRI